MEEDWVAGLFDLIPWCIKPSSQELKTSAYEDEGQSQQIKAALR